MREMEDADVLQALDSLWMIGVALLSISVALWALYFTLDDVAVRIRLVGVALRHWTPLDPADRPSATSGIPSSEARDASSAVKPTGPATSDASSDATGAGSAPAKDAR